MQETQVTCILGVAARCHLQAGTILCPQWGPQAACQELEAPLGEAWPTPREAEIRALLWPPQLSFWGQGSGCVCVPMYVHPCTQGQVGSTPNPNPALVKKWTADQKVNSKPNFLCPGDTGGVKTIHSSSREQKHHSENHRERHCGLGPCCLWGVGSTSLGFAVPFSALGLTGGSRSLQGRRHGGWGGLLQAVCRPGHWARILDRGAGGLS